MKVNRYYHTNLLFYNLRILKLEDLINLKTIMIMCTKRKIIYYLGIFKGYFRLYKHYVTRQTGQFSLQYYRTNFKSMSVSVYGVKLWNSLNDDCKTCNNEYFLRKKYKDKVFKEYQHIELQQETSTV